MAETNQATAGFPAGTAFLVLADGIYFQFDVAIDRGFVWASRYPFLLLPASIVRDGSGLADPQSHTADKHARGYFMISDILRMLHRKDFDAGSYARKLRADVIEDFQRWHPEIVLVQRCGDPRSEPCFFGQGFKITKWLSADPAFASIWSHYQLVRHIELFDVFVGHSSPGSVTSGSDR